jgi:hypothetical protein
VHSHMHCVDIHFPHFQKKGFPSTYPMLVIEDWAALGLVGGQHKVLQTRQPTHPQITTRTKCMLPEAVEKITWALHRTEAPRPYASRRATRSQRLTPQGSP